MDALSAGVATRPSPAPSSHPVEEASSQVSGLMASADDPWNVSQVTENEADRLPTSLRVAPGPAERTVHAMQGRPRHSGFTPTQQHTFDELLAIGGERPYPPAGTVERLESLIEAGTRDALAAWSENSLWLNKGALFSVLRCEGAFRHSRADGPPAPGTFFAPRALGDVAHRAIQLAHTHPGRPVAEYVTHAVASLRGSDPAFDDWYGEADMGTQSDLLTGATSRVTAFLDSWPPLATEWSPRFEEPLQAKVGRLTLSARPDLVLGRPRGSGQQTMLLADWKSGALNDTHEDEAMFYALVSTLRHRVPPFRSTVYSLVSGTYTAPDVTAQRLTAAAEQLVAGVNAYVAVLTEARAPQLNPGRQCGWCPLAQTCPAAAEQRAA